MKKLNFLAKICLPALALLVGASSAVAQTLTLRELKTLAVQHSLKLKAAEHQSQIARWRHENTLPPLLPSLDLKTLHGVGDKSLGQEMPSESPWISQFSLSLSETLYDNGVAWIRRASADKQQLLAQINFEEARQAALFDMMDAYFDYSLAEQLLAVNRGLMATLDAQYKLATSQYRSGLRTRKDFLRFRGEVQRTAIDNAQLEKQRHLALSKLALLIGEEGEVDKVRVAILDPRKATLPPLPPQAMSSSATREAKIIQLEDEANAFEVDLARKAYGPEVRVATGIEYGSQNYLGTGTGISANDRASWDITIAFDYNILDFGRRRRDVSIAASSRAAAQLNHLERLRTLTQNLRTLQRELELGKKNLGLAAELLALEEESYKLLESEFKQGRVSYLELVQGLQNLSSSQRGYYSTAFSYLTQIARHHYYGGNLSALDL